MTTTKKYLMIVSAHKSEGTDKSSFKVVLRGSNEKSLRNGLSNFLRKEIESISNTTLKRRLNLISSEEIENEINKSVDNWELNPSSEKLYHREYLYEPEPGDGNPRIEFTQVKNIIKFPLLETEYDIEVKDVTDNPRLSSCKEVIVMSTVTEEIFTLEYPEIIYIKDTEEEKDEEIEYENGHYETIFKTSSEMDEYLLCWNRDVIKIEECI